MKVRWKWCCVGKVLGGDWIFVGFWVDWFVVFDEDVFFKILNLLFVCWLVGWVLIGEK